MAKKAQKWKNTAHGRPGTGHVCSMRAETGRHDVIVLTSAENGAHVVSDEVPFVSLHVISGVEPFD